MMTRRILVLALLAGLLAAPAGAAELKAFRGKSSPVTDKDLVLGFDSHKDNRFYLEEYAINFHPWGKQPFSVRMGVSNMAVHTGTGFIRGNIRPKRKVRYKIREKLARKAWSARGGPFRLAMGKHVFEGTAKKMSLHLETKDMVADFTLKAGAPGWRPGDGKIDFGNGETFQIVVWPRLKLSGTVTDKASGKKRKVEGVALVTHSRSLISPLKQPRHWLHFKTVKKDHTILFQALRPPEGYGDKLIGWAVVASNVSILGGEAGLDIKPGEFKESKGFRVPWLVVFTGKRLKGAIEAVKQKRIRDELKRLPAIERAVVSRFVKPFTWVLRAKYEVRIKEGRTFKSGGLYIVNKVR